MNEFKFEMGARVRITESSENGTVVGRSQYPTSENNYLLRYAQSGKAIEQWWGESALELVVDVGSGG